MPPPPACTMQKEKWPAQNSNPSKNLEQRTFSLKRSNKIIQLKYDKRDDTCIVSYSSLLIVKAFISINNFSKKRINFR
jgi:hypothetical protein